MRFEQYHSWFQYHLNPFSDRYLTHQKLSKVLSEMKGISLHEIGRSVERRPIDEIVLGDGDNHVLVWSQMHGNEPTGTMAICDILSFLQKYPDWLSKQAPNLTIHLIPMLNPDGAERFSRRTALQIDPNRDAVACNTPEVRLLMNRVEALQPIFCFNLHDQRTLFSAGDNGVPAALSFLIPSFDEEKSINKTRAKGMGLVGELFQSLPKEFQKGIGKYTDEFYPTATGDNIQKQGINCLLMESGGWYDDPLKKRARLLNGFSLLQACTLLAKWGELSDETAIYQGIPFNGKRMKDVIFRQASLAVEGETFTTDISLKRKEVLKDGALSIFYQVEDIGDLSSFYGYVEYPNLSFSSSNWEAQWEGSIKPLGELKKQYPELF